MLKKFGQLSTFLFFALLLFVPLLLGATLARLVLIAPVQHGVMGYLLIPTQPFANVVANGKATANLGNLAGYTVDRIILQLGGTALTKAMLSNIRLLANEKPIFEDTGARTDTRMVYRGITAAATFLSLDFSEIRSKQVADQRAGSIDTVSSQIKQLSLEVDILGATAPTLAANAMVSKSPQSGDPLFNLLIAKVLNKTVNPGAAGEFLLNMDFSRRQNSFLKRLHLFGATVTDARVKKNGLEIFKASDAQNDQIQIEFQRTPQANQFTIDYCVDGDIKSALPLADAQTLEWYYTASGAGNVIAVAELLDPLTNN